MRFMRLALVFATLVVGVVYGVGFEHGMEYEYDYEGYLFTTFPMKTPVKVGSGFKSKVLVKHKSGNEYVFKFENFKVARANEISERFQDSFTNYEDISELSNLLEKPFKVRMFQGKVDGLQVREDEPEWIVNVKKGLLNFFHLNMTARVQNTFQEREEQFSDRFFRVIESGIFGDCETTYEIESDHHFLPMFQEKNAFNVTKVRNYDKCIHTPYRFYSTYHGHVCVDCEADKAHPLHNTAIYHYNLRGDRTNFVIEWAIGKESVTYNPNTLEGAWVQVFVNRTLKLVDVRPVTEVPEFGDNLVYHKKLIFHFPGEDLDFYRPVDLKKPHYMFNFVGFKLTPEQIMAIFDDIISHYKDTYISTVERTSVTGRFVELIRAFSTLGYEEIRGVYDIIKGRNKNYKALFFDVLGSTGSNPVFAFGKHLVEEDVLPEEIEKTFIMKLGFHTKEPTDVLFMEFFDMCQHPKVKQHIDVHRACLMTFSALLHRTCVDVHDEGMPHVTGQRHCGPEVIPKYVHHFAIPETPGTRDDYVKLMNIKILGNFGVKEIIPMLKPFINGEKYLSTPLRATAIWSLARVAHSYPKQVMALLMPVFADWHEDHEVRSAAFSVIMMCHPPLHQLERMATSLYHERNRQLISWVFTSLKHLGESEFPCHRKCAKDAKFAFRILENYVKLHGDFEFGDSSSFMTSGYDREFDFGGYTQFSFIASNSSYVPRSAYFSLHHYANGRSFSSLAFGFQARGWERDLDKFFGPRIPRTHQYSHDLTTITKELREIEEGLRVHKHEYEPYHTQMFMTIFGEEVNFFYSNASLMELIGRYIYDQPIHHDNFEYHRFMLTEDKMLSFPTECGLPVVIDIKLPQYVHYHNNKFGFTVQPENFAEVGKIDSINWNIDGTFEYDRDWYTHVAIVYPDMKSIGGAGVRVRSTVSLPIKANFKWDNTKHTMNYKMNPINHKLFFRQVQPYTYFDSYANYVPVIHEQQYKPVFKGRVLQFENNFFHDWLGFGFNVKGNFEEHSFKYSDNEKFFKAKTLRDLFYYYIMQPNANAHEMTISLTQADRDVTNEVEVEMEYDHHDTDDIPASTRFGDVDIDENIALPSVQKAQVQILKTKIVGHGERNRQLTTKMEYYNSKDNLAHKFAVSYDRTPFHPQETEKFMMCIVGKMAFPRYDLFKILSHQYLELDHKVDGTLRILFGRDCNQDRKIVVHAQWDKTDEQIHMERTRNEPVTYENFNPVAYTHQRCMRDRQNGKLYSLYCDQHLRLATQLRKATIDITYDRLTDLFKNTTFKFDEFLKTFYYPYLDNNVFAKNEEGKIHIEANMTVHSPVKADVRLFEPHENTFFTNIPVVFSRPLSTYPLAHHSIWEQYSDFFEYPHCTFEGPHIRTFDNVSYTVGLSDCLHVVAKDCSPNNEFAVFSAKLPYTKFTKSLKMFLGKYKIEILPLKEDGNLIVRLNDKAINIPPEGYYVYFEENGKEYELFRILFNNVYYTVHSNRFGVFVFYNGNGIYTQLSRFYIGKVCGMCGAFNFEKQNEMMGPNRCVFKDPIAFGYSYAILDESCKVPQVQEPCMTEDARGCVVMRNRYVYLGSRSRQMCFTTEPLPECAEGCEPQEVVKRRVGFHCLAAKDDFTRYLQRESQQRVLYEISKKTEDHYEEVEYPENCHRVQQ